MNKFKTNYAIYGNDFASYPIRIWLRNESSLESFYNQNVFADDAFPGLQINTTLSFTLVDHFNQIVNLNFSL